MDYSQFLCMREELSLLAVILILFIADLIVPDSKKKGLVPVVLLALHTLINLLPQFNGMRYHVEAFGGMYVHDAMHTIVKSILAGGTFIVFLIANGWLRREENLPKRGEFYYITLFTLLGMYFMISSGHFLMFFIGLELASVPMSALVAYDKYRYESAEAGAKFILLALFSASLLLYGVSLIYGVTGSLYFESIGNLLSDGSLLAIIGIALFISGLGFKISLVPFHLWTADTYQGAPTPVTAYLSVISKGAAAFVLFTILYKAFSGTEELLRAWNVGLLWIIIFSITIANLFAIQQQNLKRFMAFSAISQAGYLVLGVMGVQSVGMTALVYYLLVYLAANLGAFAVINVVEQQTGKIRIDDYDGLYKTNPKLAFIMTLCLFSLAGIPPFAGFFSKFFIFMAAFPRYPWLVLIALINTVLSLYYYLLIVKAMYIKRSPEPIATFKSDGYTKLALVLCTLGVVFFGIAGVFYNYLVPLSYGID